MVTLVGLSNLATLILLFLQGFKLLNFHLSDAVIIAIIGATVAELAGLFFIIIKFLFDEKDLSAEVTHSNKLLTIIHPLDTSLLVLLQNSTRL